MRTTTRLRKDARNEESGTSIGSSSVFKTRRDPSHNTCAGCTNL
jgi:hypothetical protein